MVCSRGESPTTHLWSMTVANSLKASTTIAIFSGLIMGCQPKTDPNTLVKACKSVVAAITTSNSHESMSGWHSNGISQVEYARDDDGKIFKSQCKYYPTSNRAGTVVWRGVDVWEPGGGPGIWREREYDEIVKYFSKIDANGKETIILQLIETTAGKVPTGKETFKEFIF